MPIPSVKNFIVALLGLALFNIADISVAQPAADQPNPKLQTIEIQAGIYIVKAEVAADNAHRAKGLMFRTKLGNNDGMLFVFERKAQHCFWMRNTLIPLSIAFIEDDGTVTNIEDMAPKSEDSHCPLKSVRFALEMDKGWFAKKGIAPGAKLIAKGLFGNQ